MNKYVCKNPQMTENSLVILFSRLAGIVRNIVWHKVRAAQMEICQDQLADIRMFAPHTNSNASNSKCRVVIGRHLLITLFLLVRTQH